MKLSKKSDYALRVLLTLVESVDCGPISIRELARRNDVPKRFLEHIMIDMKEQGWVRSVPGRDGGYVLGKDAQAITMGQVLRHFDGVLAPIACVSTSDYQRCSQESFCRFRRVLLEIRNFSARLLDRATLAAVAIGSPVSAEEVFTKDLIDGAGI
jgi:Rrf2 family protein